MTERPFEELFDGVQGEVLDYIEELEQDNARLAAELAAALKVVEAARAWCRCQPGSEQQIYAAVATWEAGAECNE